MQPELSSPLRVTLADIILSAAEAPELNRPPAEKSMAALGKERDEANSGAVRHQASEVPRKYLSIINDFGRSGEPPENALG